MLKTPLKTLVFAYITTQHNIKIMLFFTLFFVLCIDILQNKQYIYKCQERKALTHKETNMNIVKVTTVKEARKILRNLNQLEIVYFFGSCQVQKFGNGRYAIGPKPEDDDSDPMTDYSAWCYGWREGMILNELKRGLKIA